MIIYFTFYTLQTLKLVPKVQVRLNPECQILLISIFGKGELSLKSLVLIFIFMVLSLSLVSLVCVTGLTICHCRKKICCGTIFVGPFGEAIVDPRFLVRCSLHLPKSEKPQPQPPVTLPKIENPLFTIEKIIESELKTFSSQVSPQSSTITEDEEHSKMAGSPVSPIGRNGSPLALIGQNKVSRSPVGQSDTDADEGFYDKPSISPTNSID